MAPQALTNEHLQPKAGQQATRVRGRHEQVFPLVVLVHRASDRAPIEHLQPEAGQQAQRVCGGHGAQRAVAALQARQQTRRAQQRRRQRHAVAGQEQARLLEDGPQRRQVARAVRLPTGSCTRDISSSAATRSAPIQCMDGLKCPSAAWPHWLRRPLYAECRHS